MNVHFEKELKQNVLWPSIHASLEVYVRRKMANAEPYELVWRLIHVWESVILCLASTVAARIKFISETYPDEYRKIRELCYGMTYREDDDAVIKQGQGAFDGSINEYIGILQYVSNLSSKFENDAFLKITINFLNHSPFDLSKLYAGLNKICSMPLLTPESADIKSALRFFNQFRNKFAHVPFPHDRVSEVFDAIESMTIRLFELSSKNGNPLHGSLLKNNCILKGNSIIYKEDDLLKENQNKLFYLFNSDEKWESDFFVYIDEMMRPYVLTRVRYDQNILEYTRYFAEGNSVIELSDISFYPKPIKSDYINEGSSENIKLEDAQKTTTDDNRQSNETIKLLIENRDFQKASEVLEIATEKNPNYHVNWERLGYVYREIAMSQWETRDELGKRDVIVKLLNKSIYSFEKALNHTAVSFKAEVYYQLSKSLLRLFHINTDINTISDAIEYAKMAIDSSYQDKYLSWYEYITIKYSNTNS